VIMRRATATRAFVALMVLISGLGMVAGPGAAAEVDEDDESLVVQVDWDDAEVDDGDNVDLEVDGEMIEVVVRHSEATSDATYWVAFDDLDEQPDDGDELEVATAGADDGEVTLDEAVGYHGAAELNVSHGEVIETDVMVDEEYDELPVDVDLTVYADEDDLNSTTLSDLDGEAEDFADFEPDMSEFDGNHSHVTVQVDHVEDDLDESAFESVDEFHAEIVATGILGIGSGDNDMLIIGAIVVVAGFVLLRD